MKRVIWCLQFVFATFALSKVLEASRALSSGNGDGLTLLTWGVLLLASLFVLACDAYMSAKREGKLARNIAVFDWVDDMTSRRLGKKRGLHS